MTAVRMTAVHPSRRSVSVAGLVGGLLWATVACGTESSSGSAQVAEPEPATSPSGTTWREPDSYVYTLKSSEGERSLIGTFRVTVRDGKVAEAVGLDADSRRVVKQLPGEVPTIGELLDELEQARRDDADTAEAEYAPDGHPERISLDWDRNTIDDEALYVISAYAPAAG
ncbi:MULTISPECIES: DUF6174 domain-containing protein [unclassified Streptomyces]|uniref:DUF6174 domain-containing protein n=1 Tax=unclassified Streptomyces TaxID=2593676 RepID=UPI003653FA23